MLMPHVSILSIQCGEQVLACENDVMSPLTIRPVGILVWMGHVQH
jgi:hypothetical protein